MSEVPQSKSHPVAGLILGILGVIIAFLFAYSTGVIGGGIAVLLGVAAILLGVAARKSGMGLGSILAGALAILLAVCLTVGAIQTVNALKVTAEESGVAPMVAQYADKPYLGLLGVAMNAYASGNEDIDEFQRQVDLLNDLVNGSEVTELAEEEEAPQGEEAPVPEE